MKMNGASAGLYRSLGLSGGESPPPPYPPPHTHNDLALNAQVGLLEQPDLDPGPGLEEPEDQVLRVGKKKCEREGSGLGRGRVFSSFPFLSLSCAPHQRTIGWVIIRLTRGCWASMVGHRNAHARGLVGAGGAGGGEGGKTDVKAGKSPMDSAVASAAAKGRGACDGGS